MRFDTQDLLTLRDGDPIEAERKTRALADTDQVREIARLEQVQGALRGLPELSPPLGAWQRIAAELDRPASRPRRTWSHAAAAAVGAAMLVALAAAMIGDRAGKPPPPESLAGLEAAPGVEAESGLEAASSREAESGLEAAPDVESRANLESAPKLQSAEREAFSASSVRANAHSRLAAESARLERALAQIQFQPEVMNAGTAGTIAGLEDTVAALDEQLTFAAAGGLDPHERETLWRERVNVMRALVQVRYAQAQRSGL